MALAPQKAPGWELAVSYAVFLASLSFLSFL